MGKYLRFLPKGNFSVHLLLIDICILIVSMVQRKRHLSLYFICYQEKNSSPGQIWRIFVVNGSYLSHLVFFVCFFVFSNMCGKVIWLVMRQSLVNIPHLFYKQSFLKQITGNLLLPCPPPHAPPWLGSSQQFWMESGAHLLWLSTKKNIIFMLVFRWESVRVISTQSRWQKMTEKLQYGYALQFFLFLNMGVTVSAIIFGIRGLWEKGYWKLRFEKNQSVWNAVSTRKLVPWEVIISFKTSYNKFICSMFVKLRRI